MSRFARFLIPLSAVVWAASWGRVLYQGLAKVSPPRVMRYVTGNGGTWEDRGFPNEQSPFFVDGALVWKWGAYGGRSAKQSGFIRFDPERGVAEMRWPFPGHSRGRAVPLCAARHADGRIAILWRIGEATKLSILRPQGGVETWPRLPKSKRYTRARGLFWAGSGIEVAVGTRNERATRVLRIEGPGQSWNQRTLAWPTTLAVDTQLDLAIRTERGWSSIVSTQPPKNSKPVGYTKRVFRVREGSPVVDSLGEVRVRRHWDWLEGGPGNLLAGRTDYEGLTQLEGGALGPLRPGPLAAKLKRVRADLYQRMYVLGTNRMKRIVRWVGQGSAFVLAYPSAEYRFSYHPGERARKERSVFFLERARQRSHSGVVESFRFRSAPLLSPARGGGQWVVGTFGYYVRVDANLHRADPMGLFARISSRLAEFGSRRAQYEDFLLELPSLKKLVVPAVLAGLPVLWVIFGVVTLVARRKRNRGARWSALLAPGSAAYLLLAATFAYWFWRITVNI